MPSPAEPLPPKPPFLVSRFANAWWPAPALSFALFLLGLVLVFARAFPAPYYVFRVWEASILLHVIVAISLLVRGRTKDGVISISLLCLPLGCFFLVS